MATKPPPAKPNYVCLGVITGARGVKGEVTLKSFCQSPSDIFSYGDLVGVEDEVYKLETSGETTKALYAKFADVNDRNEAEKLRGSFLYVPRKKLPKAKKGEVYLSDVIGLTVVDAAGNVQGIVENAFDNGSNGLVLEVGKGAVLLHPDYAALEQDRVILTDDGLALLTLK